MQNFDLVLKKKMCTHTGYSQPETFHLYSWKCTGTYTTSLVVAPQFIATCLKSPTSNSIQVNLSQLYFNQYRILQRIYSNQKTNEK